MKCISVFLLLAAAGFSADFTTGQAARMVIGQPTFTDQDPNSSDVILGAASGLAYAADTLFVADSNRVGAGPSNNRVLMFQNVSGMLPGPTAELSYDRKCPVCLGQATLVLGQPDFTTNTLNLAATPSSLRLATSVASDGVHLAVADTDHNRVLIYNHIPTFNNAPADVVVGQPDFKSLSVPSTHVPSAASLNGPQGVWIQNGRLYVADTQNNRVLIWNSIPTKNGAPADVVLGQPNFTTYVQVDLTQQRTDANAGNMLNPVSVTSDGQSLYVADLGYNRILVWNQIPSTNAAPASYALGQPDLNSSLPNNAYTVDTNNNNKQTPVLCTTSNGTDSNGNLTYPAACNSTLNFPRYALASGNRLFIADGGNDRVLVFNSLPTASGASADVILGQIGGSVNQASDASDSLRTPMSLAWDGTNLYVSDAFNRRITVYSIGENAIPYTGVRNSASMDIFATGSVAFGGSIAAGDTVTISIATNSFATAVDYAYKVLATDSLTSVVDALVSEINTANSGQGDPNVFATPDHANNAVLLTAKQSGTAGNDIQLTATASTGAQILVAASSATLTGGGDASKIAPGTLVSIIANPGASLAYGTGVADTNQSQLPLDLAGTQVYFNGIRAPLMYVSPTQINAQIPWELGDTTSINAYVRSTRNNGAIVATTPVAVSIVPANPGIFAYPNTDPVAGVVLHGSSHAVGVVSVDGSPQTGDQSIVNINGRQYSYTAQDGDTLDTVRDALVAAINGGDPEVTATPSGVFDRILLYARVEGPEGNGIPYTASVNGGGVVMSAFGSNLCCANVANSPVTPDNPALPGETIVVYATGVGLPKVTDENASFIVTGTKYPLNGPVTAPPDENFMNAIAGGVTANVLQATLKPGTVGVFEVLLQLGLGVAGDMHTKLTIAQETFVSNVVTLPIVSPAPPQ
ncbi:MAG: hypothetical protein LAQ30_19505 [Acidobacteriia bacterium]|nr:hypothetical protein [Terriglobia bacterium]